VSAGEPREAFRDDERAQHEQARARDSRFARLYGAHLWHLLVLLALIAVTGYVVSRLLGNPQLWSIALWFVGAAVVWDLLLGPAYAGLDAVLRRVLSGVRASGVRPLNYVRVPLALSSLLLVVYAPLILRRSEQVYTAKSALSEDPYVYRWLAVTAALAVLSGLAFAVAVVRARR
jgi:hypothetical protein